MISRFLSAKFIIIWFVGLCILSVVSVAAAIPVTAHFYEISFSGTFGTAVQPNGTVPPGAVYPFPAMLGGSFAGSFVYDSWATPTFPTPSSLLFQTVSGHVDIHDNTGALVTTIPRTPPLNGLTVVPNISLAIITFGGNSPLNSLADFRLFLNEAFTLGPPPVPPGLPSWAGLDVPSIVAPPPDQITATTLNFGFLATNISNNFPAGAFDLPVSSVSFALTGTTAYVREVPESETLTLLALGLFLVFIAVPIWKVPLARVDVAVRDSVGR
jgi:hypothetical protein